MRKESNSEPIVPVKLGNDGIAYIKSRLEKAGNLSALVNSQFAASGEVFAPFPQGTDIGRAKRFEHGSYLPTAEIYAWLATHIRAVCGDKGCQLVFEDVWMQQKDMAKRKKPGMFFHDSRVYYLLEGDDIASLLAAGSTAVSSFFPYRFCYQPCYRGASYSR
jgi:hypothetical protein